MKNIIQNIKGTKDISADDTFIWQFVEKYINDFFTKYGYSEVRTPIFENTELFIRSIGGDTDIVSKEMYSWIDQGGISLTLKSNIFIPKTKKSAVQWQLNHT